MSKTTVLITGANRGIGVELARQYLVKGCQVIATCRDVEQATQLRAMQQVFAGNLTIEVMDICQPEQIQQVSAKLAKSKLVIDVLISNAGSLDRENSSIDFLNYASAEMSFKVNSLGPLCLAHHFIPLMNKNTLAKFIVISSVMGALTVAQETSWYGYRMSKAAVNMLTVNLAQELRQDNICVASIHPGWVKTDMGSMSADEEVGDCVAGIQKVIDGLTITSSGRFFRFSGEELPF